jgi:hypothetical protein
MGGPLEQTREVPKRRDVNAGRAAENNREDNTL